MKKSSSNIPEPLSDIMPSLSGSEATILGRIARHKDEADYKRSKSRLGAEARIIAGLIMGLSFDKVKPSLKKTADALLLWAQGKNPENEREFLKNQKFWSNDPQKNGYYIYLNEAVFSFMTERLDGRSALDAAQDFAVVIYSGMHRLATALGWDKKKIAFLNEVMKHLPTTIQRENIKGIKKLKNQAALIYTVKH